MDNVFARSGHFMSLVWALGGITWHSSAQVRDGCEIDVVVLEGVRREGCSPMTKPNAEWPLYWHRGELFGQG